MSEFTDFLRLNRKAKRMSLRRICDMTGINPIDYSQMERGVIPPMPYIEIDAIADVLELSGDETRKLHFLAENMRNNWEPDEKKDVLPAFLKTNKGHLTRDELSRLSNWLEKNV